MYFLDKRVNVICEELKKLKIKQKFDIEQWQFKEGNYFHPADAEADSAPWETFDCRNMHWYGKDRHYWFKTVYRVPEELNGKRMWLHVGTQIDEWDDAKNPQFLLFVNGEAVQGIDMNHRDVFLREKAVDGEKLEIGLSFSLEKISPTGAVLVYSQFDGKAPTGELQDGADFVLGQYRDGKWEEVPVVVEGAYGFNSKICKEQTRPIAGYL